MIRTTSLPWMGPLLLLLGGDVCALDIPAPLVEQERNRIATVERISRSTIALIEPSGKSGGSGVLISADGFALTNFHVTAPCGPWMTAGTSDGHAHDAVLVGTDPSGDIALVKLLGEGPFTPALIGDSDQVRVGDEAIVAGNPFLLAEDFVPTITCGIISGTHRYQPPSGSLLEYTDCLQTDAAINPGNSGGPLFDSRGQLIGINGRGSFEKRGRVSVGIGYAVSINQVMRFLPQLKSGRIVDHASLGATVRTVRGPDLGESRAIVDAIRSDSEAYRRGLRPGDELLLFANREIRSANELLNVVGVCPPGWRVPIRFRHGSQLHDTTVRLESLHARADLREEVEKRLPQKPPSVSPKIRQELGHYEAGDGYANQYFNRLETKRVLDGWHASHDHDVGWPALSLIDLSTKRRIGLQVSASGVRWDSPQGRFRLDANRPWDQQRVPPQAPGLLAGVWAWRVLEASGERGLDELFYVGRLPWNTTDEPQDVLRSLHRGARIDFYFHRDDGHLIGWEAWLDEAEDPVRMTRTTSHWRVKQGESVYDYSVEGAVEGHAVERKSP